ncbi:MAG: PEP-utilizing enzyme [Acidimicrobiales bacterium]
MTGHWITDTEPNERFRTYTRGNVGEVFPRVITALTGTLIGDEVRRAQTGLFGDIGLLRAHEVRGPSVGTGVFGGYLYGNGSCMRLFGARMPGMTATAGDEQVFGLVADLPPYRREKGDRNLWASLAIARYSAGLLQHPDLTFLDAARRAATAWLGTMPDLERAADEVLLEWIRTYPPRIGASMRRLLEASMLGAAPRGILERLVEAREGASPGLVNRIVAATGDVDSAQPALRLWALGRMVSADLQLTSAFDAGLDGIAERTSGTPLQAGIDAFLRDHGHRGNDEYELASPAWVMHPSPLYASIDRLRKVPADRDPEATAARLQEDAAAALEEALRIVPRPLRGLVRRAATAGRLGGIARERAKDILVLENLGARLVLHELLRRARERGAPDDPRLGFCVSIDELPEFVATPTRFADVIAARAAQERYLNDRIPPAWFEGTIPDPSGWPLRDGAARPAPAAGTVLTGLAVNSGQATGRARVIDDPGDPRGLEPGEILVCAITDPSWTPLFLSASAVVCDSGAMQSHASIVARELGIPAVMSVPGITAVADGTVLHVDGSAGTVTIG